VAALSHQQETTSHRGVTYTCELVRDFHLRVGQTRFRRQYSLRSRCEHDGSESGEWRAGTSVLSLDYIYRLNTSTVAAA